VHCSVYGFGERYAQREQKGILRAKNNLITLKKEVKGQKNTFKRPLN
jgi:hypothetical protein